MENKFKIGDRVQVVCNEAKGGCGNIEKYDIGIIKRFINEEIEVDFPNQTGWVGYDYEFILIESDADIISETSPTNIFSDLSKEEVKQFMKSILEQLYHTPGAYDNYLKTYNSMKVSGKTS